MKGERLEYLIHKWKTNSLSEEEREELFNWSDKMPEEISIPPTVAASEKELRDDIFADIKREMHLPAKIKRIPWIRYAAAVIIILTTGAYFWNTQKRKTGSCCCHFR